MENELWTVRKERTTIVLAALVSAGKSTLVNAFMGDPLFPMASMACTAKVTALANPVRESEKGARWTFADGTYGMTTRVHKGIFHMFNQSDQYGEMIFYRKLFNREVAKPYLILDTPGINDASNKSHVKVTFDLLERMPGVHILYVGNVKMAGTKDEKLFFQKLAELRRTWTDFRWTIALNGLDLIDRAHEDIRDIIQDEQNLAVRCGLPVPEVCPVSAMGALLCRMALNGTAMDEETEDDFARILRYFGRIRGTEYDREDIQRVCEATGIYRLERSVLL